MDVPGSNTGLLGPSDGFGGGTAPTVGPPASSVGDSADFVDVEVDHVAGPLGDDGAWGSVGHAAVGSRKRHRLSPRRVRWRVTVRRLIRTPCSCSAKGDACRGPFVLSAHGLDPHHHLRRRRGGLPMRSAAAVVQPCFPELAVAVDPFRGVLPGDPHLRSNMKDRAVLAALDQPAAALKGQQGVTVGHGRVFPVGERVTWRLSSCRHKTRPLHPSGHHSATNPMTHNN